MSEPGEDYINVETIKKNVKKTSEYDGHSKGLDRPIFHL
jgi:hypothetical protein